MLHDLDGSRAYRIHEVAGVFPRQYKAATACCSGEWNRGDAQGNMVPGKYFQDRMLDLLITDRRRIVETKTHGDHWLSLGGVAAFENTTTPMPSTTATLAGLGHGGWLRA